jgi:RNA recognition motif-containing protein
MNIYIGNLDYGVTESDLRETFGQFGEVSSSSVITDKFTGRSKGFGFVEMSDNSEASEAISALNGTELNGRTIKVNEAKPREERPAYRPRY